MGAQFRSELSLNQGVSMILLNVKFYKKGNYLISGLIFICGIFISNSFIINIALAQQCYKNLRPVENSLVKYKERNNRCEGFYRSDISTGEINVVGAIVGMLNFEMDKNEVIKISSPIVRNRPINIRAVGIPLKTYYRMDAILKAKDILEWPIKDVIYLKKLQYKKIGIFGWIGDDTPSKKYIPVKAVANLAIVSKKDDLSIVFRSSEKISSVKWRQRNIINGIRMKMGEWVDMANAVYESGEAISISVTNIHAEEIIVEIAGWDIENSKWLKKKVNVIVKQ